MEWGCGELGSWREVSGGRRVRPGIDDADAGRVHMPPQLLTDTHGPQWVGLGFGTVEGRARRGPACSTQKCHRIGESRAPNPIPDAAGTWEAAI
jgi:hypothetical protein